MGEGRQGGRGEDEMSPEGHGGEVGGGPFNQESAGPPSVPPNA